MSRDAFLARFGHEEHIDEIISGSDRMLHAIAHSNPVATPKQQEILSKARENLSRPKWLMAIGQLATRIKKSI